MSTFETKRPKSEFNRQECEVRLGQTALRFERLGVNDRMTYLYLYLRDGESAIPGITEDFITYAAEQLTETPFANRVGYGFTGSDFVSVKEGKSMAEMTETNLHKLEHRAAGNPALNQELARAQLEVQEITKLVEWFATAPIGAHMVFESLPIGTQEYAVSRLYQKTSASTLDGHFISLYNPSIDLFNELHATLDVGVPTGATTQEILENNYAFFDPVKTPPDQFLERYVGEYDRIMQGKTDKNFSYGLACDKSAEIQNGIQKVRKQPRLTSAFTNIVKLLASSQGTVTRELIQIDEWLEGRCQLTYGQTITLDVANNILLEVMLGIISVIDRADNDILAGLEASDTSQSANYGAMSHFGGQAHSEGVTYTNNGCPTFTNTFESTNGADSESDILNRVFGVTQNRGNFGKPKIGVCRISNCPSRGDMTWWPDRTLVGGCDICVCCHNLFGKGKHPEKLYKEKQQKQAEVVRINELAARRAAKLKEQQKIQKAA